MAALDTVQNYLDEARVLLQDTVSGAYRYSDAELVVALNIGITEAARVRPDLFFKALRTSLPSYSAGSLGTSVVFDTRHRSALLYYIVGRAQLRDQEEPNDQRATALLGKFVAQLTTAAA